MIDYSMFKDELLERIASEDIYIDDDELVNYVSLNLVDICARALKENNHPVVSWIGNSKQALIDFIDDLNETLDGELNCPSEKLASEILSKTAFSLIQNESAIAEAHHDSLKRSFRDLRDPIYLFNNLSLQDSRSSHLINSDVSLSFLAKSNFSDEESAVFYMLGADLDDTVDVFFSMKSLPSSILLNPIFTGMHKSASQRQVVLSHADLKANKMRESSYPSPEYFAMEVIAAERLDGLDLSYDENDNLTDYNHPGDLSHDFCAKVNHIRDTLLGFDLQNALNKSVANEFLKSKKSSFSEAKSIRKLKSILEGKSDGLSLEVADSEAKEVNNCVVLSLAYKACAARINELAKSVSDQEIITFIHEFSVACECRDGEYGIEFRMCMEAFDFSNVSGLITKLIDNYDPMNFKALEAIDAFMANAPYSAAYDAVINSQHPAGVTMAIDCFHRRCKLKDDFPIHHFTGVIENKVPKMFAHAERLKPGSLKEIDFNEAFRRLPVDGEKLLADLMNLVNEEKTKALSEIHYAGNENMDFLSNKVL